MKCIYAHGQYLSSSVGLTSVLRLKHLLPCRGSSLGLFLHCFKLGPLLFAFLAHYCFSVVLPVAPALLCYTAVCVFSLQNGLYICNVTNCHCSFPRSITSTMLSDDMFSTVVSNLCLGSVQRLQLKNICSASYCSCPQYLQSGVCSPGVLCSYDINTVLSTRVPSAVG